MDPSQCTWKSMLVTDADLTLGYRVVTCCIYMRMTFTNCLVYHLRNITPAYARTTNQPTCCIQSPKDTTNLLTCHFQLPSPTTNLLYPVCSPDSSPKS